MELYIILYFRYRDRDRYRYRCEYIDLFISEMAKLTILYYRIIGFDSMEGENEALWSILNNLRSTFHTTLGQIADTLEVAR